jgi:hypothetical protein
VSFSRAFLADGSLNQKPSSSVGTKERAVPITFTETSWLIHGSCGKL